MINLSLSWELVVLTAFTVMMAYSLIVGRAMTIKVILATYVAVLATEGLTIFFKEVILANLSSVLLKGASPLDAFGLGDDEMAPILIKIGVFIGWVILIVSFGDFAVSDPGDNFIVRFILNIVFGALSAGLLISTVLVYLDKRPLFYLGGKAAAVAQQNSITMIKLLPESWLINILVTNYAILFTLPALAFLVASLAGRR